MAGSKKRAVAQPQGGSTVLAHVPTGTRGDRRTSIDTTDAPTSIRDNATTMTLIEEALAAIKSRALGDNLVY
jgi:hypothetical protein